MNEIDEIVQEFLVESHENLDQLDRDLVALERDPGSRELLGSIFRTIHTIKGTSGFLAFNHLESIAHVGESLLAKLRDGNLTLTPAITTGLLEMVDAVRGLLAAIESEGSEGDPDHSALVAKLTALQVPQEQEAPATAAAPEAAADDQAPGEASPKPRKRAATRRKRPKAEPSEPPAAKPTAKPTPLLGQVLIERGHVTPDDIAIATLEQAAGDTRALGEILVDQGRVTPQEIHEALEVQGDARRSVADSTIRVDVELLDTLMTLVGELVLTRNQIVQKAAARQDVDLLRTTHRLNLIAGELQEGVMKTRMQPIDNVWSKLPRVVRDLSISLGKSVRIEMDGRDTELDKTILEAVKDPLTHIVRNAVDHGFETPEVRESCGKPREGRLLLRAYHEGGQVNIEISDDGAGIDAGRVREKAVSRGLITREQARVMSERELTNLVFLPGFSTAETVTNVSGRGVGMDVVKTNIERIGGVIDVHSSAGEGTTVRVKIPLTLAIIPALIITAAGNRYAIPQVNLLELVRVEAEAVESRIERIHGTPVYRLRGRLLPLVDLREQLGHEPALGRDATYIVVLQADQRQFGLVVDDIHDTEEIVVKPLGKQLRAIPLYAGATIMGDGRVALILDALAMAQRAHVLDESGGAGAESREGSGGTARDDRATLLLLGLGDGRQVALPLAAVDRLEEFAPERLERVGTHEVVQYREGILPLVRVDAVFGSYAEAGDGATDVVVCRHNGQLIGLVVHQIRDIVEAELGVRSHLDTGGRHGSAVVAGSVTELVDLDFCINSVDPAVLAATDLESLGV